MLRRRPFSLPYEDQIPALIGALNGEPVAEGSIRLAEAAAAHNVAGYVLEAGVPEPAHSQLESAQAVAVLHAALLRRELPRVDAILRVALGTQAVLVKGPAVADRLYPRRQLRPFVDLDVLVPLDGLDAAAEALRDHGYEELEEFRAGFGALHGHDRHLRGRVGSHSVDVELHWRIGDDPVANGLDHARLAGRAEELEVGEASVLAPAPADQLLVLAVHLLSDRAKRLAWVQDLALAAGAATDEDWEAAFTAARELGLLWVLRRALDYPAAILGVARERPLPAGGPPPWGPLRAVEELEARASTHVGRLALLPWRDRARYLRQVLVPTREGLRGTVGQDGAPTWRLIARHVHRTVTGLAPRRP